MKGKYQANMCAQKEKNEKENSRKELGRLQCQKYITIGIKQVNMQKSTSQKEGTRPACMQHSTAIHWHSIFNTTLLYVRPKQHEQKTLIRRWKLMCKRLKPNVSYCS